MSRHLRRPRAKTDVVDYSGIQFPIAVQQLTLLRRRAAVRQKRHFYSTTIATVAFAAAQSARLASESSYRSSIRESAIRQPPELLLEMERLRL